MALIIIILFFLSMSIIVLAFIINPFEDVHSRHAFLWSTYGENSGVFLSLHSNENSAKLHRHM